jgi:hypothetical protein
MTLCNQPLLATIVGLAVAGLTPLSGALGDVISLNPAADNTLYIHPTGDLSNGAGPHMFVGVNRRGAADGIRRALVRFDLSGIPAGSTISQVQLTLTQTRAQGSTIPVSLHRLTASWGESTSDSGPFSGGAGDVARPGDATWIHRFADNNNPVFWSRPGGDFISAGSSTTNVSASLGTFTWPSTPTLVQDAQRWLDNPEQNFGWIIKSNEVGSGQARRFSTRESPTTSERPVLVVTYIIPSPTGASLLAGMLLLRRRRN